MSLAENSPGFTEGKAEGTEIRNELHVTGDGGLDELPLGLRNLFKKVLRV